MAKKPTEKAASVRFTDTRRVKELIALMTENGLTEIELAEDKSRIVLRKGVVGATAGTPMVHAAPLPAAQHASAAPAAVPATQAAPEEELIAIKSPMVGTYYAAPGPDAPAYASIGAAVDDKTVVCIIEAMKVFNPIPAGVNGTVVRILVANGQAVEFGQTMFLVKPV
jgi:acetyl-CoA carboxylase biotin carboxyl carrier protein